MSLIVFGMLYTIVFHQFYVREENAHLYRSEVLKVKTTNKSIAMDINRKQEFPIIACIDLHREYFQMVNETIIDHDSLEPMHKLHRWFKLSSINLLFVARE